MQKDNYLGFGLGLRPNHYHDILANKPPVDWFEVITEDYLVPGGNRLHFLDQITDNYPVAMHGVSLSIGSCDPLDWDYLQQLKNLAARIKPRWISDHCCWTGVNGTNLHDLLPLPFTSEAVKHVAERISQVQDYLQSQILIENVSSYVTYSHSEMSEWDFMRQVAEEADCLILLDINNVYVSSYNHHFDPLDYLKGIPAERVRQFHLAGHSNFGTHIIDTHDHDIIDPVWDLYAFSVQHYGFVSTMIERDDHIPPIDELLVELNKARSIAEKIYSESENVSVTA
ncbi:MAG: DUF692 domain-containing protein [Gammaproteobacteria bacterium]|nr:DUF692 domain-containing protein [Gammaproteobacteria bacterium]